MADYRFWRHIRKRFVNCSPNRDISFYEDTGTTPKFFWDSSDESLLLSKSSGLALQVGANNSTLAGAEFRYSTVPAYITNSVASSPITIHATFSINQYDNTEGTADSWSSPSNANYNSAAVQLTSTTGGSEIRFFTEAGEAGIDQKMVINSSGNVGIGTDSPSQKLTVEGSAGYLATIQTTDANSPRLQVYIDDTDGVSFVSGYDTTAKGMQFFTGGANRLRLDASGNLGLGVVPSAWGGTKGLQLSTGCSLNGSSVNAALGANSLLRRSQL